MRTQSRSKRVILRTPSPLLILDPNALHTSHRNHILTSSLHHKVMIPRTLPPRKLSPVCHVAPVALPEPKTPREAPARLKMIYAFPKSRLSRLTCAEPYLRLSRLSPLPKLGTQRQGFIAADLLSTPLADQDDEDRCEVQINASEASVHLHTPASVTD
jgi:hypothetical protein